MLSSAHPCPPTANARVALLLLTALNFLNYIDRNVLFAVQPLMQKEFHLNDEQVGFLTSAFFVCYMVAAPLIVPLADRFPRKWIMAAGAFVWSLATLLSAVTHTYDELLLRHVIVGIGEATFVAISPAFLSDLFPEDIRGRVMGFFYLATPVGSALGYIIGGYLGHRYGWRAAVYGFGAARTVAGVRRAGATRTRTRRQRSPGRQRGARLGARSLSQQSLLDDHPRRGHDDLRHRRTASVDADVPDPRPARAAGSRQCRLWRNDRGLRHGRHFAWRMAG